MRKVILPQAIQKIAPPLAGQLISLIKDSSIVSLISVQELTFSGTEIANSSGLVYETWITIAVLYFLQIGRASCRERVCQYVSISVVAVSLKTIQHRKRLRLK